MLLVKVTVEPAHRNGVSIGNGIFATSLIKSGQPVYEDDNILVRTVTVAQYESLPQVGKEFVDVYGTFDSERGIYHISVDDARIWNHSDDPNVRYPKGHDGRLPGVMFAVRDIHPGEELTCDYNEFCDHHKSGNAGFEVL